jgi:predicted Rossmann fold flavoprotein
VTEAEHYDVIVIGGGAAGLMCAAVAGQRGRRVLLLERSNKVGKKILMSGGGRCNFTNLHTTAEHFISANPHFCKSALARYGPADFVAMVERHGIGYHEKELGQLFCDDSSKQILRMLLDECEAGDVRITTDCQTDSVTQGGTGFTLATTQGTFACDSLVIASGGLSIPRMGASGYGYQLARQFGHTVTPTRAALVPLTFSGDELDCWERLSGLSVPVAIEADGHRWVNGLLFTHLGISGPTVLQASSYWQPGEPLQVDLIPDQDAGDWLADRRAARPDAELRTVLTERLPKRMAQQLCEIVFENRLMKRYLPAELTAMGVTLNHFLFHPTGTEGYRTAEVTLGGIATDQVSSTSFESSRVPGLHFIGEVLDVTGHLGGFNFQWAWASGQAAGRVV